MPRLFFQPNVSAIAYAAEPANAGIASKPVPMIPERE